MAPWTEDNYPPQMHQLSPEARRKAIEIANDLVLNKGCDEETAIKLAIERAVEWDIDEQG